MITEDILFAPITELSRLIKRRQVTAVRLTEAYLDRIEKLSPRLNAFVSTTPELALKQAAQADKEMNAGLSRGPLHGIPFAAKDLFAVKGYPTTWGARPYQNQIFDEDAAVIRKLNDAGAILLGKCAMSEIAGGPPTASATGACRTPWDLQRWSGGSSSGSGAAVAAGLAVFALGTETWGSIMTPASFCGVTGLRPSFGRISRVGVMALSWTMDKVGILARTARDSSIVFDALKGKDPDDTCTVEAPFRPSFGKPAEKVRTLRVGFVKEDYARWGESDVAAAFSRALQTLGGIGITANEILLPSHPYETIAGIIIAAEEASAFEPLVRAGKLDGIIDPYRRGELLGGQLITAVDYLRCQRLRTIIARDFALLFSRYDIILGSSTLQCAPSIEADMDSIFRGGNSIEAAENLLGLPAASVPCGFNKDGLPIGLKIMGPPMGEANVLELAHAYQTLTDWHTRRPRM
ncbi:MAG TPA: amidase [Bacteroidota bacterium]|nr:amidase [Bacteroidota bacterium]